MRRHNLHEAREDDSPLLPFFNAPISLSKKQKEQKQGKKSLVC